MKNYIDGVIVSDLHSGSELSPVMDGLQTMSGRDIPPNSVQRELGAALKSVATEWSEPDVLVVLGDAIDGQNRKQSGVGQWSTEPQDQVNCAELLLRQFNAKKYYVIQGSGYHVSLNGMPAEEILARQLKAERVGTGRYRSAMKFMLEKYGVRCHFAHHVPSSQTEWYLTTPIAKEGIRLELQQSRLGHVDAIFRGHNHYWLYIMFRRQHLISCPCWQLPTPFMHKKSGEPITDIGAVRFRIYDKPDEFGVQLRVQKRLFPISEANTRLVRP